MSALLAGLAYIAIGRFFPNPAVDPFWWRLGAWILSAMVLVTHLMYEHRRHPFASHAARNVALGAAIGGFGLALWAAARSGALSHRWTAALIAWPLLLAIPSFIVAYAGATLLQRLSK